MVSEDDVTKIASLARLEIERDFVAVVTKHLNSILGYVAQLKDVDTSGVEAMSHVLGATNVMREDKALPAGSFAPPTPLSDSTIPPQEMLKTEAFLQNAPESSGQFIKVPLIVE